MKHSAPLYSRLALITSVTLITGYFIVSAVWVPMSSVGTGDQLTATLWNTFVGNLNDLDTRLKSTASTWPTVTGGIAYTGGNVGIGTVSPTPGYKLDVADIGGTGIRITDITNLSSLRFQLSDATATIMAAKNGAVSTTINFNTQTAVGSTTNTLSLNSGNVGIGTTNPGEYRTAIRGSTDDNTASALWVSGASSLTGALVVRNDGNVGIGTASPVMKLQVVPNVNQYGLGIIGNNTVGLSYGQYIMAGTNSSDAAFRVVNQAQNAEYMYIRGDGNVGIGTTTPGVKLEVNGSIKAAGLWDLDSTYFVNPDASGTAGVFNGSVGIGTASPTGKLHILSSGSSIIRLDRGLNLMGFEASSVAAGGFGLFDYSTSAFQWYAKNGNVGIGTTTPEANLQVNSPTGGTIRLQYTGNSGFARLTTDAANSLILGTVNSLSSVFIQDITGNVGVGTVSPGNFKLKVDGGPLGVYHSQNTNSVLQVVGKDAPSSTTYLANMASGGGADNEFLFQSDGTAKADGTWNGGGADYAEWFEKEGEIVGGALIGLNAETGKVRTWQEGDIFMGVQSLNPGFIGNNIHGAETKESDMVKTHVLVALVGQVEVRSDDIIEEGRRIMTSDGQFIGLRLSNGNVFIK